MTLTRILQIIVQIYRLRLVANAIDLTLLEVLNPTSSIHAFIKPFVVVALFSNSPIYRISAQTSGVTPETDSQNPWGSIEPRLRTTAIEYINY